MGFFFNDVKGVTKKGGGAQRKHIPIELMNQQGCKACPLDKAPMKSPKMEPSGSTRPLIYVIGSGPTEDDDAEGLPMSGKFGRILRNAMDPSLYRRDTRFAHMVRCKPKGTSPELSETECCRGKVVKDIEDTQPRVVIGLGPEVLAWATGLSNIGNNRGRPVVAQFGSHSCWFLPAYATSYVASRQRKYGKSEFELCFEFDMHKAQELSMGTGRLPQPYTSGFDDGVVRIEGASSGDFHLLEDELNRTIKNERCAIDIETTRLRPYFNDAKILTVAVGTFDRTVAFALDHPEAGWSDSLRRKVWGLFADYMVSGVSHIAHHAGFEMEWLAWAFGPRILYLYDWEDTLAQAHSIDEREGNSLDDLCRRYFGFFLKSQSRVDAKRILESPLRDVLRYNGMDTKWTDLLFYEQRNILEAGGDKFQRDYRRKVLLERALVLTQRRGVRVDPRYAVNMKDVLENEIKVLGGQIRKTPEVRRYENRFGMFRPTAPEDVLKLMKDICQRDEINTALGGMTSNEEALSSMPPEEVPSARMILEHRAVTKLLSTYIEPIIAKKILCDDGLIHTKYSSMIAETQRLASQDPNLQNFPKRKRKEIRGVVIPRIGRWFVAADYGQIEARVFAMASEDRNLVQYLWTDYDIHGFWADRFLQRYPKIKDWVVSEFGVSGDDSKLVRKTLRQEAKNRWVFPQFFGASFKSCAAGMHTPEDIAEELQKEFWDEFPGVLKWQERTLKNYERNHYVELLTGSKRRGPLSKNQIINTPIQGTAAHIVTAAMDAINAEAFMNDDEDGIVDMNIHDDLTFDVLEAERDERIPRIAKEMCRHRFDFINVPLLVEVSIGKRWHELEEVAKYRSDVLFNLRNPFK